MRILFGYRNFFNRNVRYISYKDTLNMPKSKFTSTMKNRIKCEDNIRQVCCVIKIWKEIL
jgi:hypothetical protein